MSDKKKLQLGMNPSTASGRLVKDILWDFIKKTNQDFCCKCGKVMARETFSIEHITPWLDSENPVEKYFDLSNISFSHICCNLEDSRRNKKFQSEEERSAAERESWRNSKKKNYCPEKRKQKYLVNGY